MVVQLTLEQLEGSSRPCTVENPCMIFNCPKINSQYPTVDFMVVNNKIDKYLHKFYAFVTHLFLNIFNISGLCGSPASFFKLLHISKTFSSRFIENNPRMSGPAQFQPVLFKCQL